VWAQENVEPDLPKVEWPEKLSPFCKQVLSHCFASCYRHRTAQSKAEGKTIFDEDREYCYQFCSNHPQLAKYCRMDDRELLKHKDDLVRELEKQIEMIAEQLRRNQQEESEIQKNLQAEQKRLLELQEEEKRRQEQELKKRQVEQERLLQQQKELTQQRQELMKLQRMLKKQAHEMKEAFQRQLQEEEQKRLKLQQELLLKRQREEEERRQQEQLRLAEIEKLRRESMSELEALKKHREAENKRLQEMKNILEQERELARQNKELLRLQTEAQSKRQNEQLKKIKSLQTKLTHQQQKLKNQRRVIDNRGKKYQAHRKQRINRLAMLQQQTKQREKSKRRTDWRVQLQQLFHARQFEKAKELCKQHKDQDTLAKLELFLKHWQRGRVAHDERNTPVAIPELNRALTLAIEIGDDPPKDSHVRAIRRMLANMFTGQGILQMSRKNYPQARVYFIHARNYQPEDKLIKDKFQELRDIAEAYYKRAIETRDKPTYAHPLLHKALRLIAANDPLYKKIQKELATSK
jgi:hypothetical protein